jgi:NADH dehydrogenase [ubiquinone] 1 alpha subcomplex assembly factor 6
MAFPAMSHDPKTYCLEQVRRFDRERYLCALLAPAPAISRLVVLYAFNLEVARVRETVSESLIGQMRLQWWRETIGDFASGKIRAHPVAEALAPALAEAPIRPALIERILTAREFDLDEGAPPTLAALEDYADGTSGALQQAALDLLQAATPVADEAARHVGIAWSLIGLLRALPFHAQRRRSFLPDDLVSAAGLSTDLLFEGRHGPELYRVVEAVARRARFHLAASRERRRDVPAGAIPALLPAVLAEAHLRRLEKAAYDPFAATLQQPLPLDALRLTIAAWRGRY